MIRPLEIAENVWLGLVQPEAPATGHGPRRWPLERAAARRALGQARRAWGDSRGAAPAVSCSHSEGAGAALLGPAGSWIGVDVVRTSRITRCHARAILSAAEWKALAPHARLRPALAWGLKEAAAKATHTPGRVFPWRLRIRRGGASGIRVEVIGEAPRTLEAGWLERSPFLYAWVVETPNQAQRASR